MNFTELKKLGAHFDIDRTNCSTKPVTLSVSFSFTVRAVTWQLHGSRLTCTRQSGGRGLLGKPVDVWKMREDFLETVRDEHRLLKFLNIYGEWGRDYPDRVRDYYELGDRITDILMGRIVDVRADPRFVVKWLLPRQPFPVWFKWDVEPDSGSRRRSRKPRWTPNPVSEIQGIYEALLLSVHIDLIRKTKFRKCRICKRLFPVTSKHRKIYCNRTKCGHLAAQRAYLKKKEKAAPA
jgi:hypothetical protein